MRSQSHARLWRSRWAAIGAAVAVAIGGGGLYFAQAADDSTSVFVPVTPTRVLDTRVNLGLSGPFSTGVARILDITGSIATPFGNAVVVPDGATAVVLNMTVVSPTSSGFASVRPGDAVGDPSTSNLNFNAGDVIPNGLTVALPTSGANSGKLNLYFFGNTPGSTTHMLADVVGYYQTGETPLGGGNRISDQQIAMLRWDQDPGRAATITVGSGPSGVAFDGTNIWVTNLTDGTVSKIDPTANAVTATVTVGTHPFGLAFDGGHMWVANYSSNTVTKIDPVTNHVIATVPVGSVPIAITFDGSDLWVSETGLGFTTISRINPTSNTITRSEAFTNPNGLAFDGTSIWVANNSGGTVSKINTTTFAISAPITVGSNPTGVAFDGTNIWVANNGTNTVTKIDPITHSVSASITVGSNPAGLAFDGCNIWVANNGSGTVSRINPTTNSVTATVTVGANPYQITFDGTSLWVANFGDDTVTKFRAF